MDIFEHLREQTMAEFLTTQGTSSAIEGVIMNSDKWLILVSPYLQLSRNFLDRLRDADTHNVRTIILYKENKLSDTDGAQLRLLRNVELRSCDNLHAKCYMNEQCAVITSMNMYEFSEKNNREMGVLIRKTEDEKAYLDASREVQSTIHTSSPDSPATFKARGELVHPRLKQEKKSRSRLEAVLAGHCIRCGKPVSLNPDAPLCEECYSVWADWGNVDYPEEYCHVCGKSTSTTKAKPLCRKCYSAAKRA